MLKISQKIFAILLLAIIFISSVSNVVECSSVNFVVPQIPFNGSGSSETDKDKEQKNTEEDIVEQKQEEKAKPEAEKKQPTKEAAPKVNEQKEQTKEKEQPKVNEQKGQTTEKSQPKEDKGKVNQEKENSANNTVTDAEQSSSAKNLEQGKERAETSKKFTVDTSQSRGVNKSVILEENAYYMDTKTNQKLAVENSEEILKKSNAEIEGIGPEYAQAGEEIQYELNVKNSGDGLLDNLVWENEIPTDYIRVTKIQLGTYNKQNNYDLYYKTNFSQDYILYLEDISTLNNEEIDFTRALSENEYITHIKVEFQAVEAGFENIDRTIIYSTVCENVKRDEVFENKVLLTESYSGYSLDKVASIETKICKLLPLTGM